MANPPKFVFVSFEVSLTTPNWPLTHSYHGSKVYHIGIQCFLNFTPHPKQVSQTLHFSIDEIRRSLTNIATNYFHNLHDFV